jgi:uncharacterized protein YegP (UPF0339 family)
MPTVEVYQDSAGEFRWRRVADNGRTVAEGAEGYTRLSDAKEAAERENPDTPATVVTVD